MAIHCFSECHGILINCNYSFPSTLFSLLLQILDVLQGIFYAYLASRLLYFLIETFKQRFRNDFTWELRTIPRLFIINETEASDGLMKPAPKILLNPGNVYEQ